jgi:protein-glutamine gamma-glutamyltransferase
MATFAEPIRALPAPPVHVPVSTAATHPAARFLHALLLATAFVVFAYNIVIPAGLVAGAAGAFAGVFLAEHLVARRYRLPVILFGSALSAAIGLLLVDMIVSAESFADLVEPTNALRVAEVVRWASVASAASVALRATSLRHRATLAIEGSVVVLAVATTVAAHRDGMIARPLEVSDWFWTQGIDPVAAFLGVGLCAAVLLAGILAYGRSSARTLVQLVLVLLLGLFLASRIQSADQDAIQKNALGKDLEKKKDDERDKNGATGNGSGENKDNAFKDDMPRGGDGKQNKPAAVVVFHKDVKPFGGIFYFRHAAFSQFNGIRLVETSRGDADVDARSGFPVVDQEVPGPQKDAKGRTSVATDVALLTHHNRMFALVDPIEVGPMPNPEPARFRRAYRVVSNVVEADLEDMIGDFPGNTEWSDDLWDHYTEIPKDERYHRLAAQLQGSLRSEYQGDPLAQALAVKQYLEKEATYSFVRNYEGADDPTAEFLFSEDKRGYCVHLAHATAYLMRAMGVPARVSAGYAIPAANLQGGSALLIKTGDAHAWAEIYLRTTGWVPIEVTPEKTDVQPQQFQEKDLQQLLGEMARKEGRNERQSYQGPKLGEILAQIAKLIPFVIAALIALAYAIKFWRLLAPAFTGQRRQPKIAYRAALDRLSAAGLFRVRGEPRERFAKRVLDRAPSFGPLTNAHVSVALGSSRPPEGGPLKKLAGSVGGEVRRNVPLWRWMLGLLNPVSWMWSR